MSIGRSIGPITLDSNCCSCPAILPLPVSSPHQLMVKDGSLGCDQHVEVLCYITPFVQAQIRQWNMDYD
eukprot:1954815-Amphidinium_carterae.1